jgi:hypothetical protein
VLASVAQQTVSLLERGMADGSTLRTIQKVAAPLGITVDLVLRWKGPELDRLIDARHARLVKAVVSRLGPDWSVGAEYTFNHYGDRGSVDVLAWHAGARALLLIEVKSELDSLEAVLRSMDMKTRVVPALLARERGWPAQSIASVLVLPDESVARRAVARLSPVFDVALPARTILVRQWLGKPAVHLRGVWFLADTPTRRALRNPGSAGLVWTGRGPRSHAQSEALKIGTGLGGAAGVSRAGSRTPTTRD